MEWINFNGNLFKADQPLLRISNRSFRFGEGIFETIKVRGKSILLENYHMERLFSGIRVLGFEIPPLFRPSQITQEIIELCQKNNCADLARVRLTVFRSGRGISDDDRTLQWLIEAGSLVDDRGQLNENGLNIDIYPDARKSIDRFSNLKTSVVLPYVLAARFAKGFGLDDALVLNSQQRICDSSISNVFIVFENKLLTPPLTEGCINGVMRRRIADSKWQISQLGYHLEESPLGLDDLLAAEEVFLTNAIRGIRWVGKLGLKSYSNTITSKIHSLIFQSIPA